MKIKQKSKIIQKSNDKNKYIFLKIFKGIKG